MSARNWIAQPFSTIDKKITITGPAEMVITVDYDDVDHQAVEIEVMKLVEILNSNWEGKSVNRIVKCAVCGGDPDGPFYCSEHKG